MNQDFVKSYLLMNGKYFPSDKLASIHSDLELSKEPEYKANLTFKNATLFTVLYWFVPLFWAFDRFFTRDFFGGVVKLLYPILLIIGGIITNKVEAREFYLPLIFTLLVLYGVWIVVDGITMHRRIKLANYYKLSGIIGSNPKMVRMSAFPVVMLLALVIISSYAIYENRQLQSDTNRTDNLSESDQIVEPMNDNIGNNDPNEASSTEYYEHDCGGTEGGYEPQSSNSNSANTQPSSSMSNTPWSSSDNIESEVKDPFANFSSGSGNGSGIGGFPNRKIVQEPNFEELEISEYSKVSFDLSVDENGKVIGAKVNKNNTTLTDAKLIETIKVKVLKELKYNKSKGIEIQMVPYTVILKP